MGKKFRSYPILSVSISQNDHYVPAAMDWVTFELIGPEEKNKLTRKC